MKKGAPKGFDKELNKVNKRPNILFIITDQQRADTIAALGNPIVHTPNMDRLCREGVAFTSAYTPSPVCVPARNSLAHSLYCERTGMYENSIMDPRPKVHEKDTFIHGLTRAGYRTHSIGKCHFRPDLHALRGFESRECEEGLMLAENDGYINFLRTIPGHEEIEVPYGESNEMYYVPQPATMSEKRHFTHWVGHGACSFIRGEGAQRAAAGKPWMLHAGFMHPHPPFNPPLPWRKMYKMIDMPLPLMAEGAPELHTFVNRSQNRYKGRDRGTDFNLIRIIKAYYYACISFIDYQIGEMLRSLEESGQLDNTLIFFTTDHGELLGDFGCWGKRSMHDASTRIPLIVRGPGFPCGRSCDTPVSLIDIAPTILNASDARILSHECQGEDLAAIIAGRSQRQGVFARHAWASKGNVIPWEGNKQYPKAAYLEELAATSSHMYVTREWKYFYSAPDNKEFLFDRRDARGEIQNLADDPAHAKVKTAMRKVLLDRLETEGQGEWVRDGDKWRVYPHMQLPPDPNAGILDQGDRVTPWVTIQFPDGYGNRERCRSSVIPHDKLFRSH